MSGPMKVLAIIPRFGLLVQGRRSESKQTEEEGTAGGKRGLATNHQ